MFRQWPQGIKIGLINTIKKVHGSVITTVQLFQIKKLTQMWKNDAGDLEVDSVLLALDRVGDSDHIRDAIQRNYVKPGDARINVDSLSRSMSVQSQTITFDDSPKKQFAFSRLVKSLLVFFIFLSFSGIFSLLIHSFSSKLNSLSKASIALQVGGWGDNPSRLVKALYTPSIPECQRKERNIPNLPVSLRGHVSMEVDNVGLLVCGGTSAGISVNPGRKCYILSHQADEWKDFYELNVGRVNAYIMRIQNNITIFGGSTTHPFKPSLDSEEVLDLTAPENGWKIQQIDTSMYTKVTEVIVDIAC